MLNREKKHLRGRVHFHILGELSLYCCRLYFGCSLKPSIVPQIPAFPCFLPLVLWSKKGTMKNCSFFLCSSCLCEYLSLYYTQKSDFQEYLHIKFLTIYDFFPPYKHPGMQLKLSVPSTKSLWVSPSPLGPKISYTAMVISVKLTSLHYVDKNRPAITYNQANSCSFFLQKRNQVLSETLINYFNLIQMKSMQ